MDEVDRLAIDLGLELAERVESLLLGTPVVGVPPVLDQFAEVVDRHAVLPSGPVDLVGKACVLQAMAQIVEDRVFNLDVKRFDRLAQGMLPITSTPYRWSDPARSSLNNAPGMITRVA